MTFFIEIEKTIMKFMWKNKRLRISKAILCRKSEARSITITGLKLYDRGVETKMVRHWHQNRQVDQRYRIEDTEINPHKYS